MGNLSFSEPSVDSVHCFLSFLENGENTLACLFKILFIK